MKNIQKSSRIDFRDQISKNKTKSYILMTFVLISLITLGYVISFAFDPGFFFIIMIFLKKAKKDAESALSDFHIAFAYYNKKRLPF